MQPWAVDTWVSELQRADNSLLALQGADTLSRAVRVADIWSVASVVAGTPTWAAWPVVVVAVGASWVLPWEADTSRRASRYCLASLEAGTPTWEGADTLAWEEADTLAWEEAGTLAWEEAGTEVSVALGRHSCSQRASAGSVL